jgi:hypothetical protein
MAPPTIYNMTVDPIRRWNPWIYICIIDLHYCTVRFK